MNTLFDDDIYRKGQLLYDKGYVGSIKYKDNLYAAQIKGKHHYRSGILVSDDKVMKTVCTCNNNKCIHVAALYIKLKKEKHMFIDKTFHGYYEMKDYNAMIEALPQELNQIVEKTSYANVKLTLSLLGNYLMEYNNMILPSDICHQIDDIFDDFYSRLLNDKVYVSYYAMWVEDVLTHDWLPSLSHLLCRITNHLLIKDIKRIYFEYLDYHRNQQYVDEMIHSLIRKEIKFTKKEYQIISKYIDHNSLDFIFIQIQQYLSTNHFDNAKDLFLKHELDLKNNFHMEHIEGMIYINSDNPYDYQKYVIEFYRQKNHIQDLEPLNRLINLYGDQWQEAQFKVLDELSKIIGKQSFEDMIQRISCPYYKINQCFDEIHFWYNNDGSFIYDVDKQMYMYYLEEFYSMFILHNYYDEKWIIKHLHWELDGAVTKEDIREFVYDMILKYPKQERIQFILFQFLEEVEA